MDLWSYLSKIVSDKPYKMVFSKPKKGTRYKKLSFIKKSNGYQIEKFTDKQVFHENIDADKLYEHCYNWLNSFLQLNAWTEDSEHILLVSKSGNPRYTVKRIESASAPKAEETHNRSKNYLLREGDIIPPLVDMGIFTKDGNIISSMYDKYKQINRFVEMVDDVIRPLDKKQLNIIDFGCGKSYLTFVLYYYLTEALGIEVTIVGIDLKRDTVELCSQAAKKYGYTGLRFEVGDINGYRCDFDVDAVITLHACDTATDYALYNAVEWGAKIILSVPCCQHEVNSQIRAEELSILTRYGIVQERFSALLTDSVRANILTACGYKTQLLEFVDLSHTPKNILIRAVKRGDVTAKKRNDSLREINNALRAFNIEPTLYTLLREKISHGH